DLSVDDLAFAGVQAGPHLDPEIADRLGDRARAPDRARGAVERRKEAVAGGVDLNPAMANELPSDDLVVLLKQLAPPAVTERRSTFARADDVGEHDRREHAVR